MPFSQRRYSAPLRLQARRGLETAAVAACFGPEAASRRVDVLGSAAGLDSVERHRVVVVAQEIGGGVRLGWGDLTVCGTGVGEDPAMQRTKQRSVNGTSGADGPDEGRSM